MGRLTHTAAGMTLHLPDERHQHWRDALADRLNGLPEGPVDVDCGSWRMTCTDLKDLQQMLEAAGLRMRRLQAQEIETVVSASALGLDAVLRWADADQGEGPASSTSPNPLYVHRGTLRSGDRLQSDHDLLVFGDVNPGAHVSASGDVMVWGRLRGTAHAGKDGATGARIISLHLRPLQLRIAGVVARGPEDQPIAGFAEQARLADGEIVIEPAQVQPMSNL